MNIAGSGAVAGRERISLSALRILIAVTSAVLCTFGCSGPPSLALAILPQDRDDYSRALAREPANPKRAFLEWRATQRAVSIDEANRRDDALSTTRNPFDANHDRRAVSLGAVVYATHCQRCHGAAVDGRGPDVQPGAPCRDFHAFDKRFAVTLHRGAPKAWFAKIHDGHGGVVNYPDGPSTAMPAFSQALSKEQIWLVITYLQSLDMYVSQLGGESDQP